MRVRLDLVRLLQIAPDNRVTAVAGDGFDRRQAGSGFGCRRGEPMAQAVPAVSSGFLRRDLRRHPSANQMLSNATLDDRRDRLRVETVAADSTRLMHLAQQRLPVSDARNGNPMLDGRDSDAVAGARGTT